MWVLSVRGHGRFHELALCHHFPATSHIFPRCLSPHRRPVAAAPASPNYTARWQSAFSAFSIELVNRYAERERFGFAVLLVACLAGGAALKKLSQT